MLVARLSTLDRAVDAHPFWAAAALAVLAVACWQWIQWKEQRDLQPLCDELGFAFKPGSMPRGIRGTVAGRDTTVTLITRGMHPVRSYAVVAVSSKADAAIRFAAQHWPALRRWGSRGRPMDGVDLRPVTTGDVTFDARWRLGMDHPRCALDIFDEEVRTALEGLARSYVDVRYDGASVQIELATHRWRSDASMIRRALDAALLVEGRLQPGRSLSAP